MENISCGSTILLRTEIQACTLRQTENSFDSLEYFLNTKVPRKMTVPLSPSVLNNSKQKCLFSTSNQRRTPFAVRLHMVFSNGTETAQWGVKFESCLFSAFPQNSNSEQLQIVLRYAHVLLILKRQYLCSRTRQLNRLHSQVSAFSQNHRTIAVRRLLEPPPVQSSCTAVCYSRLHRKASRWVLNISQRKSPQPSWAAYCRALSPSWQRSFFLTFTWSLRFTYCPLLCHC